MIKLEGCTYISEKQISKQYGFSHAYFWRMRKEKTGPKYYKIRGRIFYKNEDLDKWFKENLKPNGD